MGRSVAAGVLVVALAGAAGVADARAHRRMLPTVVVALPATHAPPPAPTEPVVAIATAGVPTAPGDEAVTDPPAAPTPTTGKPRATTPPSIRLGPEARFEAAAARIRYPWRDLGYEVVVERGRRGMLGLTSMSPPRVTLYVRADESVEELAFVFAHEIGHAVDFSMGDPARRQAWLAARGLDPQTPWFGCNDCDDLGTPAGDFAESFAVWQVGAGSRFRSRLGPPPDAAQLGVLAALSAR